MLDIQHLRNIDPKIICIGSHKPIIQSMLDFDFLSKKQKPSIKAIIATGRNFERFFYGNREILIPVFSSAENVPHLIKQQINIFFNTTSARRVKQSSKEICKAFPHIIGGTIFAEDVPEKHSLELYQYFHPELHLSERSSPLWDSTSLALQNGIMNTGLNLGKQVQPNIFIVGPASVGLIIPGSFKLGAIGGTDYRQLVASDVMTSGTTAVLSASGGMVGEIIRIVSQKNKRLSFALSFGGDRFPILSPKEVFLAAQNDPRTETIIYYGELGGTDEYDLAELIRTKRVTKQVICYIAGTVSELFDTPPQFGHAKAMAKSKGESAEEKRNALKEAGVQVAQTFTEFVEYIEKIPSDKYHEIKKYSTIMQKMSERKHALITSTISSDKDGDATILGENLLSFVQNRSFAAIVASMFLGKNNITTELESFVDLVLRIAVDHGPYVSGAVNTIVSARAGKDLVSSLAAGLLTIGPRFGGAINQAANNWLQGVIEQKKAYSFVEEFASKKIYISGIGHRKYRIDFPDPRVTKLLQYRNSLDKKRFTTFALNVQEITTAKKGNLILNVDGAIAAVLLDILSEKEKLSDEELKQLTDIEFFNSLFVLSRSVGFIAHYLDQKRLDEGLFRLPDDLVTSIDLE